MPLLNGPYPGSQGHIANAVAIWPTKQPGPLDAARHKAEVLVSESDMIRLLDAAYRSLPLMPEAIRNQVAELLTPQAMAVLAGVTSLHVGSHCFEVGEALDLVIAGAAVVTVGDDAIRALRAFGRFASLAVRAQSEQDLDEAARAFAAALLVMVGTIGWRKLGTWLGKGLRQTANLRFFSTAGGQLPRWRNYINAMELQPPRDRGMLWSSLGGFRAAENLAHSKGLVSLEMILKKNGFFELYAQEFGTRQNGITREIWQIVSRKYARSLEGRVTGYAHRTTHFHKINKATDPTLINPSDPVLVNEIDEISKILLSNPKITELTLIDVETGEAFGYRTRELLESLQRLSQKPTFLPHLP
ncbi:MAG: hypothetical protein NTW21_10775 [Verrucomicrobia bacterium]|nr:hypothetical protein [Verrucomicrobiota bacterium]